MQDTSPGSNTEEWRPIVGHNGRYEISSLGRVKSVGNPRRINHTFIMKPQPRGAAGYLGIGLTNPNTGQPRSYFIQRLVAEAFLGPVPPGMQVNHIDGNKHNNALSNLEYTTAKANTRHALRNGWKKSTGGGRVLTPEEVLEIRATPRTVSCRELAERYGTSYETIRSIWNGTRWVYLHDCEPRLSESQIRALKRREGKPKLTADIVRTIRQRAATEKYDSIAADYGYTRTGIYDIVKRNTWAWVE